MKATIQDTLYEKPLSCGYVLSGPAKKRNVQLKIHKKVCETCRNSTEDLSEHLTIRRGSTTLDWLDLLHLQNNKVETPIINGIVIDRQ